MSDISNSNSSSSSKRRLSQIDDTIECLTQEVDTMNDFVCKTEFEFSLMSVKMKREKVKALSAVANSQVLLANMKVMVAESDLFMDIERLRNFKRRKLDHNEGKSQEDAPSAPQVMPPTKTTVSVQTTESMSNKEAGKRDCVCKKKKRRQSSSRKSPVDISSDDTVIIPSIHESSASLVEASQTNQTSFSLSLFTQTPANKSDSEVSLTSSIKEEFINKPYTQEPVKKSPAKKHKSDAKSKSKNISKHTQSPTNRPKTVAELKKSVNKASTHMDSSSRAASAPKNSRTGDKKSTASETHDQVRHNMGVLHTQSSSSTMSPFIYVNPATQANMHHHSQKANNSQTFNFYGSKQ